MNSSFVDQPASMVRGASVASTIESGHEREDIPIELVAECIKSNHSCAKC
jgi:hypothetical protein